VNARCAPGWILGDHAKDEFVQLCADTLPASMSSMPREPSPIGFEASSVPANDGFGLDENQGLFPSRPDSPQHHLEQSIRSGKARLRKSPPQYLELLPKRQIFQEQVTARTEEGGRRGRDKSQQPEHETSLAQMQVRGWHRRSVRFEYRSVFWRATSLGEAQRSSKIVRSACCGYRQESLIFSRLPVR